MKRIKIFEIIAFMILITNILIVIKILSSIDEIDIKNSYENIYIFSDDSWFLLDREKGEYIFQPVELGDWDYEVENEIQLKKIIATYFINKYNMNENKTIDKVEKIFKNLK